MPCSAGADAGCPVLSRARRLLLQSSRVGEWLAHQRMGWLSCRRRTYSIHEGSRKQKRWRLNGNENLALCIHSQAHHFGQFMSVRTREMVVYLDPCSHMPNHKCGPSIAPHGKRINHQFLIGTVVLLSMYYKLTPPCIVFV